MRILCIYAYFEKNQEYQDNLRFFLKHGLNDGADFAFVLNGKCSVPIPSAPNIIVLRRENTGYDFGAYTAALDRLSARLHLYDFYFFLNTSVRGPFLPRDYPQRWQSVFVDMLRDDVKLVGTTINMLPTPYPFLVEMGFRSPYSHVQTQMFAMDKECFEFLRPLIFADDASGMDFYDVVEQKEIAMSQYVLNNGWNINCALPKYRDLDYRTMLADINPTSASGDPSFKGKYFGGTYTPYDVVFIKTNRDLLPSSEESVVENYCQSSRSLAPVLVLCLLALLLFALFKIRR
jgi:hypothetical protein